MGRLELAWAGLMLMGLGSLLGVAAAVGVGVVLLLLGVAYRRAGRANR